MTLRPAELLNVWFTSSKRYLIASANGRFTPNCGLT